MIDCHCPRRLLSFSSLNSVAEYVHMIRAQMGLSLGFIADMHTALHKGSIGSQVTLLRDGTFR